MDASNYEHINSSKIIDRTLATQVARKLESKEQAKPNIHVTGE